MSITLRCRGPDGQATLSVDSGASISNFRALLAEKTGVPAHAVEVLAGFPPRPLNLPDGGTVAALGLANGDALTVRRSAAPPPPPPPPRAPAPPAHVAATPGPAATPAAVPAHPQPAAAAPAAPAAPAFDPSLYDMDEDEALARAIAASLGEAPHAPHAAAPSAPPAPPAPGGGPGLGSTAGGGRGVAARAVSHAAPSGRGAPAPTCMPVPGGEGSVVVRRIIDSDNSCLFNAVGYVVRHSRALAPELRRVVAEAVAADPVTFNEGFLGKPVDEYCRWISRPDTWGGPIELFILAAHFRVQIGAYDIRTRRCDVYGQDAGHPDRCLLIYDGLHYDALAVAAFEGAGEELDVTVWPAGGAQAGAIVAAAERLVAAVQGARQFTDTANFTLRCGVCQIGIKGEKEAVEHAKATGHSNFAEY